MHIPQIFNKQVGVELSLHCLFRRDLKILNVLVSPNLLRFHTWLPKCPLISCACLSKTEFISTGLRDHWPADEYSRSPPSISLNIDFASTLTFTVNSGVCNFGVIFNRNISLTFPVLFHAFLQSSQNPHCALKPHQLFLDL